MNILILTHNFPKSSKDRKDAGFFIYETANKLAIKNNVYVYCPNYFGKKQKYKKFNVVWFPRLASEIKLGNLNFKNPLSIIYFFSFLISGLIFLPKVLKKNKIDVILCYWSFPNGLFALFAKKFFNIQYITFSLGSDIFVYGNKFPVKTLNKTILNNAKFCLGNSKKICKKVNEISNNKCVFVPSSTNFVFKNYKLLNIFDNNKYNYLFVGRLEKVKGVDVLLRAYLKFFNNKSNKLNVCLHIVGDGEMKTDLEKYVVENKIDKYVKFYGNVSDQALLSNFYHSADCLIIPSRSESMPFVALEASNFGLPLVVSDVGDLKYFVSKYKVGLYFENENVEKLHECLTQIQKTKINNANFLKIQNDYSFDNSVFKLIKIINEVK